MCLYDLAVNKNPASINNVGFNVLVQKQEVQLGNESDAHSMLIRAMTSHNCLYPAHDVR